MDAETTKKATKSRPSEETRTVFCSSIPVTQGMVNVMTLLFSTIIAIFNQTSNHYEDYIIIYSCYY